MYYGSPQNVTAFFDKIGYPMPHRYNPADFICKYLKLGTVVVLKCLSLLWPEFDVYGGSRFIIGSLTLVPMEFPIKFDKVKLGWSILYIEGSQDIISKKYCISFSEDRFCLSKQC